MLPTTEIKECSQKFSKEKKKKSLASNFSTLDAEDGGSQCLLNPERNGFNLELGSLLTSLRYEAKQIFRHVTGLRISTLHLFSHRKWVDFMLWKDDRVNQERQRSEIQERVDVTQEKREEKFQRQKRSRANLKQEDGEFRGIRLRKGDSPEYPRWWVTRAR